MIISVVVIDICIEGVIMKINELLDGIRKSDIVLPEFQREYVWSRDQAKRLIDSLHKEYPVGSLPFWKTNNPSALKNIDNLPEKLGLLQVMLDGQQRLTTLYMLINGSIPHIILKRISNTILGDSILISTLLNSCTTKLPR